MKNASRKQRGQSAEKAKRDVARVKGFVLTDSSLSG